MGSSWEVLVRQKSILGPENPARAAETTGRWRFAVERELLVDGAPAIAVAVTCQSADLTRECYRVFFDQESLTLRRLEVYPSGWTGKKIIHWYRRSDPGPTVTAYGYVPLSMPVFGPAAAGTFRYEHCINGPNGFTIQADQHLEQEAGESTVRLSSGSTRIVQTWRPGLPWPLRTTVNDGRLVAELIVDTVHHPGGPAGTHRAPGESGDIDTGVEFGAPAGGRWWPLAASTGKIPWSRGRSKGDVLDRTSEASTSTLAWSGYWWPMLDSGGGERLWQEDGPLDKYDYYVRAESGSFPSPYATSWEFDNHRTTDQKNTWWGHCNGWAAASILEPEPAVAAAAGGIFFSVADKKGILTEWHNAAQSDGTWGNRYYGSGDDLDDIYPDEFMVVLIQHIVSQDEPVVMDLDCYEEVWNHPIYGYEMEEVERSGDEARFACRVYYATDAVSSDFVGTWEQTVKYEFRCTVDDAGNPVSGPSSWEGPSATEHPDFLWHPGTERADGNPALESGYVHAIAAASPADYAHIEIRHPYRGDLSVKLGAGDPANPDWVITLSDEEGGSADDLILDVDLSAAVAFLPPGSAQPWFLLVSDLAAGDEGRIGAFTIRYDNREYAAAGLPVDIVDGESSQALIGSSPSSSSFAHVEIQHPYRGDLVVKVGAGDPASPDWVATVSDREGGDADDLIADVDLSGAAAYLPPDDSHPWFLAVADEETEDAGSIVEFTISHHGLFFSSSDPPVTVPDLETGYAYIGSSPSSTFSCQAHIDIEHSWRGDLVVRVGAGDPADPDWVTTVSDREGEDAQGLVMDVDVCAAVDYLPPDRTHPWFLEVTDLETGDEGSITAFALTFDDATYSAAGLPIAISDGRTSHAFIGSAPASIRAQFAIQHPFRGDLVVRVGAGDPANPVWIKTVCDREGDDSDDLFRDVDLSDAEEHLPPDSFHPWFLAVSDDGTGDEGSIERFVIYYEDREFTSGDTPAPVADHETAYAYIGGESGGVVPPLALTLHQNCPNPFNPVTTIRFDLPAAGPVTLRIYDLCGRSVRTLASGSLAAGVYTAAWDGRDDRERVMASGTYYCRLVAGERTLTTKMVMLR